MSSSTPFFYSPDSLRSLSERLLSMALDAGATDASTEVSESSGLHVSVRMHQLETLERTRDKGAALTVYLGKRRGHATTSDFSDSALQEAVQQALAIAKFTEEDECAGLPDREHLALNPPQVDAFRPWDLSPQQATDLALQVEAAALGVNPALRNSDGASVGMSHGQFHSANSRGFSAGYPYSRHDFGVAPIAMWGDLMQRDYWSTSHRDPSRLASPDAVGRYAAQRTLARLGARPIATQTCPVLFEAPLAVGLIGALVHALSGSALYRKASFLVDSLGQQIFPEHIHLDEDPFIPLAMGSSPFDEEGVRVSARKVVEAGRIQGYFLATYSGRKLGMPSTGHAGGSHNLRLTSSLTQSADDLAGMLRRMGRGLLVTELMGHGVNGLTGDYSRGAFGYWVENGEIQHPVEEITIAGNLKEMFKNIVAVGADEMIRGSKATGSVLISDMRIAGT